MKISEPLLLDSNVLVYAHNEDSSFHSQALKLVTEIIRGEIFGVLSSQNLLEFYSVITDERRLDGPLAPKLASGLVNEYLFSPFEIIYPNLETNKIIIEMLKKNEFKNGQVFDVFLVATMLSNDIRHIVTANVTDFKKFDGISVHPL